jgi:hypothetical protein
MWPFDSNRRYRDKMYGHRYGYTGKIDSEFLRAKGKRLDQEAHDFLQGLVDCLHKKTS